MKAYDKFVIRESQIEHIEKWLCLKQALWDAIQKEDYEDAALLRDKIATIEAGKNLFLKERFVTQAVFVEKGIKD